MAKALDPDSSLALAEGNSARMLSRRQALAAVVAGATLLGGGYAANSYSDALSEAQRLVRGKSHVIATRFGNLEYAVQGRGSPILMIHGTGGGFDQGLHFASAIMRRGHRIIAPSRFGYLRSSFPADPSSENQADAFVQLLDHLGIERVPVAGGSAGALSAAQFALRHSDRCAGLILLVPAANVRGRDPVQMSALQEFAVRRLLASDFLFWSALNAAPGRLIGSLLATDPQLLNQVSPTERARACRILEQLMPISARTQGMLNDARLAGDPARMDFARIAIPTLIMSAEDDRFGTAATARDLAGVIPGARLVMFESGGHIWLGHDEDMADEVVRFVSTLQIDRHAVASIAIDPPRAA